MVSVCVCACLYVFVLCRKEANKYALDLALHSDISVTITHLAPQLYSAGTAHKKADCSL